MPTDKGIDAIKRGRQAVGLKRAFSDLIFDREYLVIEQLVYGLRAGSLTTEQLWCSFGQVVGLRDLLEQLDDQIKSGERVARKELPSE